MYYFNYIFYKLPNCILFHFFKLGKNCIELCIENMRQCANMSPLEVVDMFVTVSYFLKDSSEVSQVLLDDFNTAQGYAFLSEFLLK